MSQILGAAAQRAKSRLSNMAINEVSLVDAAANLRKWVLTKRDNSMSTEKMTLKLPGAAKQGIMDGLASALDKATALSTMIGDAEVDDAAVVPAELGAALMQVGEMFEGMATQYAGSAADAADANKPPANEGGQPPPTTAESPTGKALPPPHTDPGYKSELHDGDSLKQIYTKAIGLVGEMDALTKAGRKIAGHRYKSLQDLHSTLGKLLNDLAFDEASEANAAAGGDAKKNETAATAKNDGGTATPPSATPVTEDKLAEITKAANDTRDALLKRIADQDAKIAAITKASGVSNAGAVEGDGKPPSGDVKWASDMSAERAAQKQADKKK